MSKDLIWIDHQGGKLGFYLNEKGDAVLCDFIGDTPLLFIPASLGDAWNYVDVSVNIPDESFQSCTKVKYIIFDCHYDDRWNIGYFVFSNCKDIRGLIDLGSFINDEYGLTESKGDIWFDDFSFTKDDYSPRSIDIRHMTFEQSESFNEVIARFIAEIILNNLEDMLFEALKYRYGTTSFNLEAYDNPKVINDVKRIGVDPVAFTAIGQCWEKVNQE